MEFKKGSRRNVLCFPKLGFVIKLPKFLIRSTLRQFYFYSTVPPKGNRIKSLKRFLKWDNRVMFGFKNLMLKGIYDNWNEYRFYSKNHNIFTQPTYFSLFGFVNIQKYSYQVEIPLYPLFKRFQEITNTEAIKDGHHFTIWSNFCFENNKIKIVDYGSESTQAIVLKYGEKIFKEFDLEKLEKVV